MRRTRIVWRSLWHYRRLNAGAAVGIAVGTAVIVGALAVGDSLRGTLRSLALARLGQVELAVVHSGRFRQALADELTADDAWSRLSAVPPAPLLQLPASARVGSDDAVTIQCSVLGVDHRFWQLFSGPRPGDAQPTGRQTLLSRTLADDLGAGEGDAVLVSLGTSQAAPVNSIFGRRDRSETVRTLRTVSTGVVPQSVERFSLTHDEYAPRTLFVDLGWLQEQTGMDGQANLLLVGHGSHPPVAEDASARRLALERLLGKLATLADYGLRLRPVAGGHGQQLEAERLVLPGTAMAAADAAALEHRRDLALSSVYLANTLRSAKEGGRIVPYSVVAAFASPDAPGGKAVRFVDGTAWEQPLLEREIVLNAWLASELAAGPDNAVALSYYVTAEDGTLTTETASFVVRGVVAMDSPIVDRGWVPTFKGITDAEGLRDWDPPFPLDLDRIEQADEDYWDQHRAAPKAFVSPTVMRRFWGRRSEGAVAGEEDWLTAVRFLSDGGDGDAAQTAALSATLRSHLARSTSRLQVRSVREEALTAAKGSSDFGGLFLGMGFFLVVAAGVFAGFLLRLNVERRTSQAGILLATGMTARGVFRILFAEGAFLAAVGALAGAPLGLLYADALLGVINSRWRGMLGKPLRLELHIEPVALVGGAVGGWVVGLLATAYALRLLRKRPPLQLLSGWRSASRHGSPRLRLVALSVAGGALGLGLIQGVLVAAGIASPALAFFGLGSSLLVAFLAAFCAFLARKEGARGSGRDVSRRRLARRGMGRQWQRSLLTVAVVACAVFMIVAVAANRRDVTRGDTTSRESGTGGFRFVATTSVPLHQHLEKAVLDELGPDEAGALTGTEIVSCRLSGGDEISCLNVQRPAAPRVIGVGERLIGRGGFRFKQVDERLLRVSVNPWGLLDLTLDEGVVPAFADADSAQWILHKKLGDDIEVPTPTGKVVRLRLVGLLQASIFAGELLVGEGHFLKHFGDQSGYRYFLIDAPPERQDAAKRLLSGWDPALGLKIRDTDELLAAFAEVQNTYLSAFETLGGLGLLLGALGLGILLLRHAEERRAEFALMQAVGFRERTIARQLAAEVGTLLVAGSLVGAAAALVAVAPHLVSTRADVQWGSMLLVLGLAVACGLVFCGLAARHVCRGDLLQSLRSE